jgi:hypothetical protein
MNELVRIIIIGMIQKQMESRMLVKGQGEEEVELDDNTIRIFAQSFQFSETLVSGNFYHIN